MNIKDKRSGIHHGYIGLALMLIGFLFIFTEKIPWPVSLIVTLVGLLLFVDDYYQHIKQRKNIAYRSPLNRLYSWFITTLLLSKNFHWLGKFIIWLNEFFDNLLGRFKRKK